MDVISGPSGWAGDFGPGHFVFVLGDDEAKRYLREGDRLVDRYLVGLIDDITDYASHRLQEHAPGRIKGLVSKNDAVVDTPGVVEGVAGVSPDRDQEARGIRSDPADFPFYVDIGTGIHGEYHRPIITPPGHVMVFTWRGVKIFTHRVAGQPAQHYGEDSYQDTLELVPTRIMASRLPGPEELG